MAGKEDSAAGDGGTESPWHRLEVELGAAGEVRAGIREEPGTRSPACGTGWRLLRATEALEEDKQSLRVVNHQLKANLDNQRVSLAPCKLETPLLQLGAESAEDLARELITRTAELRKGFPTQAELLRRARAGAGLTCGPRRHVSGLGRQIAGS